MAFTIGNLKVKSAKCLCLLSAVLVLVLRIWSFFASLDNNNDNKISITPYGRNFRGASYRLREIQVGHSVN